MEEPAPVEQAAPVEAAPPAEEPAVEVFSDLPRRSVAFIGSECHPFVKTGGLGDVMYALPRELVRLNCDVRVILPRYACIPQKYQEKMVYRGEFYMDLGKTGRQYYVGIMEYVCDGVVYDFIDNQEFFSSGNPYINLVDDIPKYCFFSKAALAALNFMNWIPDIVHCHDWQAALVPVYLRTLFKDSPVGKAKSILTIHNLRFQGIYNIPTIQYWSGLPGEVFNMGALKEGYEDANMLKGGLAYADRITTVSGTYEMCIRDRIGPVHTHQQIEGLVVLPGELPGCFPLAADAVLRQLPQGGRVHGVSQLFPAGGRRLYVKRLLQPGLAHQVFHDEFRHGAAADVAVADE